jgi:hypothetical protein
VRSGFNPAKHYAHHQLLPFTKNTVEAEGMIQESQLEKTAEKKQRGRKRTSADSKNLVTPTISNHLT